MKEKLKIYHNKKSIILEAKKLSFFGKFIGLMFRTNETGNLLFSFKNDVKMAIHSYFVYFPFLAVWMDKNNRVLEFKTILPFTSIIKPDKEFRKLIEIPFNNRNMQTIDFFVGKAKI